MMVRVTVSYTADMLRDFFRYTRFGRAACRLPLIGACWVLLMAVVSVGLLIGGICSGINLLYAFACTAFFAGILPYGLFWLTYYKLPDVAATRTLQRVQGRQLVCIFERDRLKLQLGSGGRTETLVYGGLHKVVETSQYFYIYKTRMDVNIIPKAAFDDNGAELHSFLLEVIPCQNLTYLA